MFTCGWFSSGRDRAAIDLFTAALDHMENGFIPGKIAYVFCDREPGESAASDAFLSVVRQRGLPLITHSSKKLRQTIKEDPGRAAEAREGFDAQVIDLLKDCKAQVVVLAGYMLIVSPLLCRTFLCLNLHPAVPGGPKGTWQEVMWQIMATGRQEAGGMMHLATPELDEGPPVAYFRFALSGPAFTPLWAALAEKLRNRSLAEIQHTEGEDEPLFAKIRAEELKREFPLILLTLKNLAEGAIRLTPGGAEINGRLIPQGLDLTEQVEEFLRRGQGSVKYSDQ
jgi:phosphoribosylglycinamide formyltransferase 1